MAYMVNFSDHDSACAPELMYAILTKAFSIAHYHLSQKKNALIRKERRHMFTQTDGPESFPFGDINLLCTVSLGALSSPSPLSDQQTPSSNSEICQHVQNERCISPAASISPVSVCSSCSSTSEDPSECSQLRSCSSVLRGETTNLRSLPSSSPSSIVSAGRTVSVIGSIDGSGEADTEWPPSLRSSSSAAGSSTPSSMSLSPRSGDANSVASVMLTRSPTWPSGSSLQLTSAMRLSPISVVDDNDFSSHFTPLTRLSSASVNCSPLRVSSRHCLSAERILVEPVQPHLQREGSSSNSSTDFDILSCSECHFDESNRKNCFYCSGNLCAHRHCKTVVAPMRRSVNLSALGRPAPGFSSPVTRFIKKYRAHELNARQKRRRLAFHLPSELPVIDGYPKRIFPIPAAASSEFRSASSSE